VNLKASILYLLLEKYVIPSLKNQPANPQLKEEKKALHNILKQNVFALTQGSNSTPPLFPSIGH